jgi:hypothetical protein
MVAVLPASNLAVRWFQKVHARYLGPLVKARAFGMTTSKQVMSITDGEACSACLPASAFFDNRMESRTS